MHGHWAESWLYAHLPFEGGVVHPRESQSNTRVTDVLYIAVAILESGETSNCNTTAFSILGGIARDAGKRCMHNKTLAQIPYVA